MLKSVSKVVAKAASTVQRISMEDELKIENLLVLDVRESQEALQGPVVGSIDIPRSVLEMKITDILSAVSS
jgi:hypothetical protein